MVRAAVVVEALASTTITMVLPAALVDIGRRGYNVGFIARCNGCRSAFFGDFPECTVCARTDNYLVWVGDELLRWRAPSDRPKTHANAAGSSTGGLIET